MATTLRRLGHLTAAVALAAGAVITGSTPADADPPRAWTGGTQADFGTVRWVHEGWYAGAQGNWHLGELVIEEDDDVLTGSIVDWKCPDGVRPPDPFINPPPPTTCKQKDITWVSQLSPWDVATFDHERNRLTISGEFDEYDTQDQVVGTVPIDVTFAGVGAPVAERWLSPDRSTLDYSEYWESVKVWGRFDGHRVSGPDVTQTQTSMSFYVYGMTRRP